MYILPAAKCLLTAQPPRQAVIMVRGRGNDTPRRAPSFRRLATAAAQRPALDSQGDHRPPCSRERRVRRSTVAKEQSGKIKKLETGFPLARGCTGVKKRRRRLAVFVRYSIPGTGATKLCPLLLLFGEAEAQRPPATPTSARLLGNNEGANPLQK